MPDFLLELGLEEIPARMVVAAWHEFASNVYLALKQEQLLDTTSAPPLAYFTPRRITVFLKGLNSVQPDIEEQLTGPATKIAYKDGKPTPAAEAFAKKAGVPVDTLQTITNSKGEYLSAKVLKKGRSAVDVLTILLPIEISVLSWPKSMYWRAGKPERFVRPLRWMVALLDDKVVPIEFAGIKASNESRGHRVFSPSPVKIVKASDYKQALEKAHVLVDPAERTERIRKALDAATRAISSTPGARWREDESLVSTVVNLTEWPSVIAGNFEKEYLTLPEEVLVTVMRDHQKYFAVEDKSGKLAPHFLAVLNTDGDGNGLIQHGNERVLRARFNDARFFWETDQKTKLADRVEMLKSVTFQKDLGSYWEKARRISHLATIGGADLDRPDRKVKRNALYQAAWLCKTDLTTELVKEFTELQGIVGGLYARAQGHEEDIATAVYDHYKPESMEDTVPRTLEGALLSLSDKADTIAGMFALGLKPSGSKDPFALRRAANGMVKIIAEHHLPLDIALIFHVALAGYKNSEAEKKFTNLANYITDIHDFFRERLEFYLKEVKKHPYDEVNAVLAAGSDRISDAIARAEALGKVRKEHKVDFDSISIAFKRIKNILKQAHEAGKWNGAPLDPNLIQEPSEKQLYELADDIAPNVARLRKERDYQGALREIARLRSVLDAFFEKVMVMAEDEALRNNRLAMLHGISLDFTTIADFSEIVTEKK